MPFQPIREVVQVLTFGATKYSDDNWKRVPGIRTRYFSACMRHIVAWQEGEEKDQESGFSHLAHAICCIIFLMWEDKNGKNCKSKVER